MVESRQLWSRLILGKPPNLLNQHLFLLLQLLGDTERDLENLRHEFRRRQSKPLRQGDVRHVIRLVNLYPDEVFSVRRILDIMAIL